MNRLNTAKRAAVVAALVEGNSIRSTVRITSVAMNTILKLLAELGLACAQYQDEHLRGLRCRRIQCDEVWQFCYAKAKNVPAEKKIPQTEALPSRRFSSQTHGTPSTSSILLTAPTS